MTSFLFGFLLDYLVFGYTFVFGEGSGTFSDTTYSYEPCSQRKVLD